MTKCPNPPRLVELTKWANFPGYGFNLHAEKARQGEKPFCRISIFTFLLAVSEANESKSDNNYVLILEYACLSGCDQKTPCFGVSLGYGVIPCYGVSQCYGVRPCHGFSPCYISFAWVTRPKRPKGAKDEVKWPVGPLDF